MIKGQSSPLIVCLFQDAEDQTKTTVCGFTFATDLPFGPGINPERGFRAARAWLDQCLIHHECGNQVLGGYPKRILDIQGDQVKVLKSTKSKVPYVSLSHRWGGPEHRRLISTVTTIQEHERGIPWSTLPKTFQNAVTICRHMEVNYLWIDTLCILQLCPGLTEAQVAITKEEFAEQNSIMASIYRGSYFTIYAGISTNMDSGIFATNLPRKCFPLKVTGDDGNDVTIYVKSAHIVPHSDKLDIDTRGWTFQEFVKFIRPIYFFIALG
ncbi:heterokaryon incompatibility protein-domain-containing protein, partial [Whalleya microplaca]